MNKLKTIICFIKRRHLINEEFCPYTKKIYQTCLVCSKTGVKSQ